MNLGDMPSEIRNEIASRLVDNSRRAMRTVSTTWFNLIKYGIFNINGDLTKEDIQTILNSFATLNWLIELNLSPNNGTHVPEIILNLTKISNLRSIRLPYCETNVAKEEMMKLTHLGKHLEYWGFNLFNTPIELFHHFSNIKSIRFDERHDLENNAIEEITKNMSRLESLDMRSIYGNNTWPFEKIQYPLQLTALRLTINSSSPQTNHSERFSITRMYNLKEFICDLSTTTDDAIDENTQLPPLNMLTSLQHLELTCTQVPLVAPRLDSNSNLTELNLDAPDINSEVLESMKYLVQMRSLYLTRPETKSTQDFMFLTAMTALESFAMGDYGQYDDYRSDLYQFIVSSRLTRMAIEIPLDLLHITLLTTLKHLIINAREHKNLTALSCLPSIEDLRLSFTNEINVDLSMIGQMTRLTGLSINTRQSDTQLWRFPNMEKVMSLQSVSVFSGSADQNFLDSLENCTNLEKLVLTQSRVNFDFMKHLPLLTYLYCANILRVDSWSTLVKLTQLRDLTVPAFDRVLELTSLINLKRLYLTSVPQHLREHLTKLTHVKRLIW